MDPTATAHAATGATDYLVSMGLPGLVIMGLAVAYWFGTKRINELTDKAIELTGLVAAAQANSTAAINRMADMLQIKRDNGGT